MDSLRKDTALSRRAFVRYTGIVAAAGGLGILMPGCTPRSETSSSATATSVEASGAPASSAAAQAQGASSAAAVSSTDPAGSAASSAAGASSQAAQGNAAAGGNRELVLIYSRANENYNVGWVDVGNTMVLAQFIQAKRGCDLFELEPVVPYAEDYQTCIDYALAEQERGGRPELKALPDLSAYDTIFFGFPIWWGDIPMPVYTAIEALGWEGKTIAPFNTHEGSYDGGMFATLARVCAGSTVLDGLTVQGTVAQQQRDTAEQRVDEWLASLGF